MIVTIFQWEVMLHVEEFNVIHKKKPKQLAFVRLYQFYINKGALMAYDLY